MRLETSWRCYKNRPKDWTDVADVLFIQGNFDENHLRTWAVKLQVLDGLEAALLQQRSGGDHS